METLEQALERIKELESQNTTLETEKSALIRKRDELLGELKTAKGKLSKFADYADRDDIDIAELLDIRQKYEAGETDLKGKYEEAYKRDKDSFEKRLKSIEQEREQERQQREAEQRETAAARLKADSISEFSKEGYGIRNPEQFFRLFGDKIQRNEEGKLFIGDEYKQQSVKEYIEAIGEDNENSHHFKARGGSGVGAATSAGGGKVTVNPFKPGETFNLTEQGKLYRSNPDLARRLAAEVGVKLP